MILVPAIPQDLEFHNFSDQRTLLNIPHFWNVVSNVPFVLIGLIGLYQISKNAFSGILEDLIIPYKIFFLGLILVGLSSGYYHLDPTNNSLVWDRMAITISFMSFFTISIGESVSIRVASKIFLPLLIIGILSVIYWHHTETLEEGDLRIYAMVQFLPIVLIPIMLMIYGSVLSGRSWILSIILCYGIAKAAEMYDGRIYEMTGFSGHSLKHLIAAVGAYVFLLSFKFRKPLNSKESAIQC